MNDTCEITGSEKASMLLIALGKEYSSKIMKHLYEEEIEQLTIEISNMRTVDAEKKAMVIDEFYELCLAQNYVSEGGIDYARQLLINAFGTERAFNLIEKITSSIQIKPFDFLRKADANQIFNIIQNENPQTIGLVSSYLHPQQAAQIISVLPQEKQAEIIERIANMGSTSPENIQEVARVLERKFSTLGSDDYTMVGGVQATVDIINSVDISTEKRILTNLEETNRELAEEIRRKMFVFEDIVKLDSRAIQRIIKETDNKDLTIALKGSTKEVLDILLSNMSNRLQGMIKDDLEFMPPVRLREVEEAQQKIVNTIRKLEELGEIIIVRNEGDEMIG